MKGRKVNESAMALVNGKHAGPAAMRVINEMQHLSPELQCVGGAMAFLLMCDQAQCHPGNAMGIAKNLLADAATYWPEVRALKDYVKNEL